MYRLNDSLETMELNSTDVTVVVTDLDPFNYYVFYVLAFTVASSDPSENRIVLTAEAGKTTVYAVYTCNNWYICYCTSPRFTWKNQAITCVCNACEYYFGGRSNIHTFDH